MGTLRHTCAKVREPSELRFRMVRVVDRGIAVLDGGPRRERGRGDFEGFVSSFLHCVAAPLQRGLFLELHCASAVRAGPAGLHRGVRSRWSVVEKTVRLPAATFAVVIKPPRGDLRSETALLPNYFGQTFLNCSRSKLKL